MLILLTPKRISKFGCIMHIAIAGNIGSGKTTLTKLLARHYGYRPVYESTETNPYINSFYEDMRRWAFNIQIYYLHTRTRQLIEIHKENNNIIQDRTLYEDAYIFTHNLHAMGLMNTRDFENYQHTFELISSFLQPPDLLIYLRTDVPSLVRNIQNRGRDYENSIRLDYLSGLNKRYEDWIDKYNKGKVVIVDCTKLDFVANSEDLGVIYNLIDAEINSLFVNI